jgi:hypothetical protein
VDPGDLLGLDSVGAPLNVAVEGAAGAQDALELQAGEDVGVFAIAVSRKMAGVKRLETRRHDDRAHVQGELLVLLAVLDGAGLADRHALHAFGTDLAVQAARGFG